MSAIDVLGLLVPLTYLAMLAVESIWPARKFPKVRGWKTLGIVFLIVLATVSTIVPLLIPIEWLEQNRLVDGTGLGVMGGAIVGYVLLSAMAYAWHRSVHNVPLMWRLFHQMHHSPQRMDMSGAAVFHPLEMTVFAALSVAVTTLVIGLDPLAAALTGYIAAFYSFFQHMNVHTPHWLGYFIQRPEAHCVHHQRDLHANNYGDLPIWDILFRTFRNPYAWEGQAGFDDAATRRFGGMLAFMDVNEPNYGPKNLGSRRTIPTS
ncbi:MAG: sterol desaturase family protein [Betaproteobacteria bacterium]|nr:sterol desaturase family protein [Betaproteobacteria bacterium]